MKECKEGKTIWHMMSYWLQEMEMRNVGKSWKILQKWNETPKERVRRRNFKNYITTASIAAKYTKIERNPENTCRMENFLWI